MKCRSENRYTILPTVSVPLNNAAEMGHSRLSDLLHLTKAHNKIGHFALHMHVLLYFLSQNHWAHFNYPIIDNLPINGDHGMLLYQISIFVTILLPHLIMLLALSTMIGDLKTGL